MIQNDIIHVRHIAQIPNHIYKSIQSLHHLLNEPICMAASTVYTNKLKLSYSKSEPTGSALYNKYNKTNKILLVEDDEVVKDIIITTLRNHNFNVVGCSKGEKALVIFERNITTFHLCIVDIGLPDIEGPDLVGKLLLQKPNINVLFISGYNETKLKGHFPLIAQHQFLNKPFRLGELLNKVRSVMLH